MSNELVDQVMQEVMKQMGGEDKPASSSFKANPGITEFVGTAEGDTIGLVIANLDAQVSELLVLTRSTAPSASSVAEPARGHRSSLPTRL